MRSIILMTAIIHISLPINLSIFIVGSANAQDYSRYMTENKEQKPSKLCDLKSDFTEHKNKITARHFTLREKITFANKALFGNIKKFGKPGQKITYLYAYNPHTILNNLTEFIKQSKIMGKSSILPMETATWIPLAITPFVIVKKDVANNSWWKSPEYVGYSTFKLMGLQNIGFTVDEGKWKEKIKNLSLASNNSEIKNFVQYLDQYSKLQEGETRQKMEAVRDGLCVLWNADQKDGMIALGQKYGAIEPDRIYYTWDDVRMDGGEKASPERPEDPS